MAQTTNSSESNAKFAKLSEDFIHETLAMSPSNASQAGYHQHVDPKTGKTIALDALLDDVSPAGIAEQRGVYTQWRERFRAETPLASLGAEDAADWQLIDDQIASPAARTTTASRITSTTRLVYVELIGSALFQPLTDDYAAEEVRARPRPLARRGDPALSRTGARPAGRCRPYLHQGRGRRKRRQPSI